MISYVYSKCSKACPLSFVLCPLCVGVGVGVGVGVDNNYNYSKLSRKNERMPM